MNEIEREFDSSIYIYIFLAEHQIIRLLYTRTFKPIGIFRYKI